MKKYELIIFDWDGTIVDSFHKIIVCVQRSAKSLNLPVPTSQAICQIIGLSFKDAWPHVFPQVDIKWHDAFFEKYCENFYNAVEDSSLFPAVRKLLNELDSKNYLLAVATGKGRRGLNLDLKKHKLSEYFVTTKTVSECFSKPHPQMVQEILNFTGIENEKAIVIGDSLYDIQMAANANTDAIHITQENLTDYGYAVSAVKHKIKCISELAFIL